MESQGKGEEEIPALLMESSEIGANGAERIKAVMGSEAAGYFLFDLGHAYRLLGDVVREKDVVIGHETPNIVGMNAQVVDEIECLALAGTATLAGRQNSRVGRFTLVEDAGMSRSIVANALGTQRAADGCHFLMRREQQIDQRLSPSLLHLLNHVGQFAQVMSITQAMRTVQITVRPPTIVDQRAGERAQKAESVKGFLAPVRVRAHPGQRCRGQHMQPANLAGNTHAGLVGMRDGHDFQRLAHGHHRRLKQRRGFFLDRQDCGLGQRQGTRHDVPCCRRTAPEVLGVRWLRDEGVECRTPAVSRQ